MMKKFTHEYEEHQARRLWMSGSLLWKDFEVGKLFTYQVIYAY